MANSEYQPKRLGYYSDIVELHDVFRQLVSVLGKDGLYPRREVILKLEGSDIPTKLTSDTNVPSNLTETEQQNSLFITDVVTLLTGVAKNLALLKVTDKLSEFSQETRHTYLLVDIWHEKKDDGVISEQTFSKLLSFINRLESVFEETSLNLQHSGSGALQNSKVVETQQPGYIPAAVDETNSSKEGANQSLVQNTLFIFAVADRLLISNLLEKTGFRFEDLPKELQDELAGIRELLRKEIIDYIGSSPEFEEFLSLSGSAGDLNLRLLILRKVLIHLLSDPSSNFYVLLNAFYKKYIQFVKASSPSFDDKTTIDDLLDEIQIYYDEKDDQAKEELKAIREKLRQWKQQILQEVDRSYSTNTPLPPDSELEKKIIAAASAGAPAVLAANELAQLETHLTNIAPTLSAEGRRQIQNQSSRVVWGTLAELFRESDVALPNVAPQLFNSVHTQALSYLLSLPPDELNKLRTSPSSLIRHIKNLRDRILRDPDFTTLYQAFQAGHDTPIISRANRVEKETEWGYTQLHYELFGAHNITDETTPDEAGLQDLFDDLKVYLHEKVYLYINLLHEKDLQQLYIRPDERKKVLYGLHTYINSDATFSSNLSRFYQNFLSNLGANQKTAQQQQLLRSLQRTVSSDGVNYTLKVDAGGSTPELFSQTVLNTIRSDNQILMKSVSGTLDSLILSYGLDETQELINNVNPQLLEITFGLPKGMITEANIKDFRSVLVEYSSTRTAQFSSVAGAESSRGLFGAVSGERVNYKTVSTESFIKRMEPVKAVREVVQNNSGEEIAEATSKVSQKDKAKIFFKMFEKSWTSLSQEQQIAIYLYYGKPVGKQFIEKKANVGENLALPLEFIEFQSKDRDGRLLDALVKEYQIHGAKEFNPLLTAQYSSTKDSTADHFRKIEQLRAALTLYYLEEMAIEEQEEIARIQGYESAQQLLAVLESQKGAQGLLAYSMTVPAVSEMVEGAGEYIPATQSSQSLFSRVRKFRRTVKPQEPRSITQTKRLTQSIKKLASSGISKQAAKKAVSTAVKAGLGAATAGLATVAITALQNKQVRETLIYGGSYLIGQTLYALSTIGGAILGSIGGIAGFLVGGPLGSLLGTITLANLGASWWPQQWGSWFGFTPRQPPGLESLFSSQQPINPSQVSMEAIRSGATNAAVGTGTAAASTTGATSASATASAPASISASTASSAGSAGATTGATAAGTTVGLTSTGTALTSSMSTALSSMSSWFAALPLGVAAPLIGLFSMILITMYTVMVIAGAFIVPLPTRDSNWKGDGDEIGGDLDPTEEQQPGAQFVEVTKTPSVNKIENGVNTPVTYKIKVTPKGQYSILVKNVSDTFNSPGTGGPSISSGFGVGSFPTEAFSEPLELEYTVPFGQGLTDVLVTNNLILTFEVYDINGFPVNRNETYKTAASVRVGNPKEGCWPHAGRVTQLPYNPSAGEGLATHDSPIADAYDVVADVGTPIYAPFSGEVCRNINDMLTSKYDVGYGIWMTLKVPVQGGTANLIFAHLNSSTIQQQGTCRQVSSGELIGTVGLTGSANGIPHSHYELKPSPVGGLSMDDLVPKRTDGSKPKVGDLVDDCH